jgi:hypothetical protein
MLTLILTRLNGKMLRIGFGETPRLKEFVKDKLLFYNDK